MDYRGRAKNNRDMQNVERLLWLLLPLWQHFHTDCACVCLFYRWKWGELGAQLDGRIGINSRGNGLDGSLALCGNPEERNLHLVGLSLVGAAASDWGKYKAECTCGCPFYSGDSVGKDWMGRGEANPFA